MGAEQKLLDVSGRMARAASNGQSLNDADFVRGRLIITDARVVFITDKGKKTIPLTDVESIGSDTVGSELLSRIPNAVTIQTDTDTYVLATEGDKPVKSVMYEATINGSVILVRHPVVIGGVVQDDANWTKARIKLQDPTLDMALSSGKLVQIDLSGVSDVTTVQRDVTPPGANDGENRFVTEITHTMYRPEDAVTGEDQQGGRSQLTGTQENVDGPVTAIDVETHITGKHRVARTIANTAGEFLSRIRAGVELDEDEREIVTALYSGMSPFEVPDFLGMDVDEVEQTYQELVENNVLNEVRKRSEVELAQRGRTLATEIMQEE